MYMSLLFNHPYAFLRCPLFKCDVLVWLLMFNNFMYTVEPLLEGHHWDSSKCPYKRGVLISGVVLYI